jgi:hypothetical protein
VNPIRPIADSSNSTGQSRGFLNTNPLLVPADFLDPIVRIQKTVKIDDTHEEVAPEIDRFKTGDRSQVPHGFGDHEHSRRILTIKYYDQDLALIESEVAFVGHYLGVNQIGPAADFNRKLIAFSQSQQSHCGTRRKNRRRRRRIREEDGRCSDLISLDKFIELGIVIGSLGSLNLFPLPAEMSQTPDPSIRILPKNALLGGFGEPGHMNRENVRFVFTNVVYAMKALGLSVLSSALIGTLRKVLNTQQSVRSIIEGIAEGMGRFDVDQFELRLAFDGEIQGKIIQKTLRSLKESNAFSDRLQFEPADRPEPEKRAIEKATNPNIDEVDVDETDGAHITVTSANVDEFQFANTPTRDTQQPPAESDRLPKKQVLKYSALSATSIIPVRRVAVQAYFADMLPKRVLEQGRLRDQWQYGYLMMRNFVPEDFQKIIEDSEKLNLVLDRETAQIPWEMAGFKLRSDERFFGTDLEISRQFRSVLGETNGHSPELNHIFRILIIADPASSEDDALEFAKQEGIDVARVIADARQAYGDFDDSVENSPGRMDIKIYLRIGNRARDGEIHDDPRLTKLIADCGDDIDIDRCEPIDILKLLMTEDFDAVHYAGHGSFDPESGEMGWLIDSDCFLTAEEIFRVRRVPRLVFANACHSGRLQRQITAEAAVARQVSMAEAFFSRGIANYVGTAWAVDDDIARTIAISFYRHALGVNGESNESKPAFTEILSIGAALKEARREAVTLIRRVRRQSSERTDAAVELSRGITWGAYQHYGSTGSKLIAPLIGNQED